MNIDPNDPAYPQTEEFNNLRPGLTKREELIFRIAAGLAAKDTSWDKWSDFAYDAISIADAVLAEMNKSNP